MNQSNKALRDEEAMQTSRGKMWMGVDVSNGSDYSAYTIVRGLRWYDGLLRKLRLSKATWEFKVIDAWTESPKQEVDKEVI